MVQYLFLAGFMWPQFILYAFSQHRYMNFTPIYVIVVLWCHPLYLVHIVIWDTCIFPKWDSIMHDIVPFDNIPFEKCHTYLSFIFLSLNYIPWFYNWLITITLPCSVYQELFLPFVSICQVVWPICIYCPIWGKMEIQMGYFLQTGNVNEP